MKHSDTDKWAQIPLTRLNAVRIIVVMFIAIGYASTMSPLSGQEEVLRHLGYDPSWFGLQIIFCLSGYLAIRSLTRHGSSLRYLLSRAIRNVPLLIAYTLATVLVIYPIFCKTEAGLAQETLKLTVYFFKTVLFIDPGSRLPGILDDAKYMCLIQGAIWTFRWGAIAHIAMAVGWRLNILKSKNVLLALALLAVIVYGLFGYVAVKNNFDTTLSVFAGLRLGYAFLAGAALYGWQDKLPQTRKGKAVLLAGLASLAIFQYSAMPWTPGIEITATLFWTYLAIVIIQTPMSITEWMNNWPNIVLGLYLTNWPVSQILVMLYPELQGWALIGASVSMATSVAIFTHAAISGHINRWAATALRRKIPI
jgi:peptidoglycan/LPS O-acetylase OafA/YrhL